jgi:hypothetical protein
VIKFKKSKQDLIAEEAIRVKELLDDLDQKRLFLMEADEFNLFSKILSDLNVFLEIEIDSDNIDQILGFNKAQALIGKIVLQLYDGEADVFDRKEDNIRYVH